jgi:type I restriction enzyme S subunit
MVAKASNENLCPLYKNDITMVMSDIPNGKAFAKCFYIPEDDKYTLNQRICALTAKKGTDSKFLYYQMNRNNYYLAFNNGVSQTNLKKEEVLECPLLMPDIEEQIQIVKLIDTATEELNQYQQKLEALQLQKKGLMQQLLTGQTRVKI